MAEYEGYDMGSDDGADDYDQESEGEGSVVIRDFDDQEDVGKGTFKVKEEDRITSKFMTKYEKARVLGTRAL